MASNLEIDLEMFSYGLWPSETRRWKKDNESKLRKLAKEFNFGKSTKSSVLES